MGAQRPRVEHSRQGSLKAQVARWAPPRMALRTLLRPPASHLVICEAGHAQDAVEQSPLVKVSVPHITRPPGSRAAKWMIQQPSEATPALGIKR